MPTYSYTCTQCHYSFEKNQSFTEASLTVCPKCGGRLKKNYQSVGVVFKGTGFYRNDARDNASSTHQAQTSTSDGQQSTQETSAASEKQKTEKAPKTLSADVHKSSPSQQSETKKETSSTPKA